MKLRKFTVLTAGLLLALFVASCSGVNGGNSGTAEERDWNNGKTETKASAINISSNETSATVGDMVTLFVAFANFESQPTTVDVYVKESNDAVKTGIAVSDGKITLDTSYFEAGTYNLYVASGSVKSNSIEVTLTENTLKVPTGLAVVASTEKANTINLTWTAPSDTSAITYYWIYYSTINDTTQLSNPSKTAYAALYVTNGTGKYDITLSESGTYYFWVKSADGSSTSSATKVSAFSEVASYEFTYSTLTKPTNVKVIENSSITNGVTITWTASDAPCYWIYYSTTNDTTKLTSPNSTAYGSLYVSNGTGTYNYIVLEESGTYYFWVKAADNLSSSSGTSDFSEVAEYSFTYTDLVTPKNVNVTKLDNGKISVSWTTTDNAYCYWIYYSITNDTAKLTSPNATAIRGLYVSNGTGTYNYVTLTETGTYYFWVKAANGSSYNKNKSSDFSTAATYIYSN